MRKLKSRFFIPEHVRPSTKTTCSNEAEVEVEHASAKDLIAQISTMDAEDELFDAKVIVLGGYIDHHVEEQRNEMFPKARKSNTDLRGIVADLKALKEELIANYEVPA